MYRQKVSQYDPAEHKERKGNGRKRNEPKQNTQTGKIKQNPFYVEYKNRNKCPPLPT